jgi:hypothetical protein
MSDGAIIGIILWLSLAAIAILVAMHTPDRKD